MHMACNVVHSSATHMTSFVNKPPFNPGKQSTKQGHYKISNALLLSCNSCMIITVGILVYFSNSTAQMFVNCKSCQPNKHIQYIRLFIPWGVVNWLTRMKIFTK